MRMSGVVCAVALTVGMAFGAGDIQFTSAYSGTDTCKDACEDCGDGDIPMRCTGVGGYSLYETYSSVQTFRSIEKGDSFTVDLSPLKLTCNYSSFGAKIEWRLAGGKPFAVIHRMTCFCCEPDKDGRFDAPANRKGEVLMVRGLKGFEGLSVDIDTKTDKKANESARKAADDFYRAARGGSAAQ